MAHDNDRETATIFPQPLTMTCISQGAVAYWWLRRPKAYTLETLRSGQGRCATFFKLLLQLHQHWVFP